MSSSSDKRWEEKEDNVSAMLRQQNEELIKRYEHQCQISKDLAKENEELFLSRRKYTVAIDEIKRILKDLQ